MSEGDVLPQGWTWTDLNEVCVKIQDGTHYSPKVQEQDGDYKYITAKNVRSWGLDLTDVSYISEEEHSTIYRRCDPQKGDVLLVKDGVNTGDVAMNTLDEEFSLLSSVCLIRPNGDVLYGPFARYYLLSPIGCRLLTGQMTGTAIKRIILRRIKEVSFSLAPFAEQHRIVEKIEELFTKLDAGVRSLEQARALLESYRRSVLKAAVEGELSREWREAHGDHLEPASELLERILQERRVKFSGKKYKEPATPDTSDLSALPDEWKWASVEQVGFVASGQTPKGVSEGSPEGSVPWFRVGDMNSAGNEKYMHHSEIMLNEAEVKRLRLHVRPTGTIIFPKRGGAIATNKKRILNVPSAYDLNTMGILPSGISAMYFWYWFLSVDLARLSDGSNVPQINHGDIEPLPIPIPPLQEQTVIADELERRLSVVDKLEATVEANLKQANGLRQSILKQAFSSKLVPQHPDDEPASALLERIRAERGAAKAKAGKGRKNNTRPTKSGHAAQRGLF